MVNADPLSELVGFLHDKNPQVRAVAAQELVPYSTRGNPRISIFKSDAFRPITDLRILILDEPKTAHDSLTILINLSQDPLIRSRLVDEIFLNMLLAIIVNKENGLADLACMLLSNLAKADAIKKLLTLTRTSSITECPSPLAMNQLLDVYVRGHSKTLNPYANYDFLTNLFSDLTRFEEGRTFFSTTQPYDGVIPLSKITVFTDPQFSQIRRTGVASVMKNCCFDITAHETLLDEAGINLLLYLQTPLCGPDSETVPAEAASSTTSPADAATDEDAMAPRTSVFKDDEVEGLFESLQFLPDDKAREPDAFTLTLLLDGLLLLTATAAGRRRLRDRQTYPILRQLHRALGDRAPDVGECCDKLVNVLARDDDPDLRDLDPLEVMRAHQQAAGDTATGEGDGSDDEEMMITEV